MKVLVAVEESLLALEIDYQLRHAGQEPLGPVFDRRTALALATSERPFLAIVDLTSADLDEQVRLVRSLHRRLGIRSVVIADRDEEAAKCGDAAVGVLIKPFPLEELPQSIDVAAEWAVGDEPDIFPAPANMHVVKDGTPRHRA